MAGAMAGADVIVGDNGTATFDAGLLSTISTTEPELGARDVIDAVISKLDPADQEAFAAIERNGQRPFTGFGQTGTLDYHCAVREAASEVHYAIGADGNRAEAVPGR